MTRRGWFILFVAAIALAGGGLALRNYGLPGGAAAQSPPRAPAERVVPVRVAMAVKKPVPVRIEALGSVTPMASVAIKARLETEIVGVHFQDGAEVKAGDQLFTLDSRALQAQILQAEGALARDKAQLEGAERDVKRFSDLLTRNAGTPVSVDNAKTQSDMLRGTVRATESALPMSRLAISYGRATSRHWRPSTRSSRST